VEHYRDGYWALEHNRPSVEHYRAGYWALEHSIVGTSVENWYCIASVEQYKA
jgi:hypothetical protein